MSDSYLCNICGERHDGAPLSWGPDAPDMWVDLPSTGREKRGEVGTDQAMIDEEHFFIRGRLEIPVVDTGDQFAWLVWVEVKVDDLFHMSERWTMEDRETTSPYEGRLANNLGVYSHPTLGLQVKIHTRPVGERPYIEVLEDHMLFHEQRDGISSHRVRSYAAIRSLVTFDVQAAIPERSISSG